MRSKDKDAVYIGVDQYGHVHGLGKHPRKGLMEALGRKSASKMYHDTKDGRSKHVGYVCGGLWVNVFVSWEGKP